MPEQSPKKIQVTPEDVAQGIEAAEQLADRIIPGWQDKLKEKLGGWYTVLVALALALGIGGAGVIGHRVGSDRVPETIVIEPKPKDDPKPDPIDQKLLDGQATILKTLTVESTMTRKEAKSNTDAIVVAIKSSIPKPTPTPTPAPVPQPKDSIAFDGPTEVKVGDRYTVKVTISTAAFGLDVWERPGQTSTSIVHGDTIKGVATADGDIWFEAACVVGKKIIRSAYKVTVVKAPQPPPPPVPMPVDPFQSAIQDAYVADGKPAAQAAQLASIYKLAPTDDKSLKTYQAVFDKMHRAVQLLMTDDVLKHTRSVIKDDLESTFGAKDDKGWKDRALDDAGRRALSGRFGKIQAALEGVK